tara:strand:- start:127 stop:387 length:261 start_codon:yes stop_codon:yes gene_type:complete
MNGQKGDRIRLIKVAEDDPDPVPPGSEGEIVFVDDAKTRHVNFDNGRSLGLIPNVDQWEVIPAELKPFPPETTETILREWGGGEKL